MINPSTLKVPSTTAVQSPSLSARLSASKDMLTLSNGTNVKNELYQAVFEQVSKRHSKLLVSNIYTAEKICGYMFWISIPKEHRNQAGICLHDLVKKNRVPFIVAESLHEYPLKYYPISSTQIAAKGAQHGSN